MSRFRWFLMAAVMMPTAFSGWQWWTVPRVDPELIGEWVEEFERDDGSRFDLTFRADGACEVGIHSEETHSSFLMANFPSGISVDELRYSCDYAWGISGEGLVLSSNVTPEHDQFSMYGQYWMRVKAQVYQRLGLNNVMEFSGRQVYQITERRQSRLHLRQVGGKGRFPKELKLVRWQD